MQDREQGVDGEERPPATDDRRPYERPVLEHLGSVEALTRGGAPVAGDDFDFTGLS